MKKPKIYFPSLLLASYLIDDSNVNLSIEPGSTIVLMKVIQKSIDSYLKVIANVTPQSDFSTYCITVGSGRIAKYFPL